ncbi:MAG: oligosaccharide flippase family protein [Flavobacteriales bacterium]|nr:oligosaccharide flippase family protein [Flavobacteriales bacterium]
MNRGSITMHKTTAIVLARMKGQVMKKLFSNTLATGFNFVAKWIFNFALSKLLTTSAFGAFSLVYSMANVLMNCISFGANLHLIYGVSRNKRKKYDFLLKSVWISTLITALAFAAWLIMLPFEIEHVSQFGWSILLGYSMALSMVLFSFFKGLGQFDKEAKGFLLFFIVMLGVLAWLMFGYQGDSLGYYCMMLFICTIVMLIYGAFRLRIQMQRDGASLHLVNVTRGLKLYWKEKLPYGLHEMQGALYTHINIILLGFLVSDHDLGIYRSIQLLIVPVSILPSIFSQVQLNQLTQKIGNTPAFLKSFRLFAMATVGLGLGVYLVYFFAGEPLIGWMYNYEFDASLSGTLITCFTLAFLVKFFSSNYGVLITSVGNQRVRVYVTFISIVLSVSLTLIFAQTHGIIGAAYAMVAANVAIFICYAAYGELIILKRLKHAHSSIGT